MPRLNRLYQIFDNGPSGGAIIGQAWPFEPTVDGDGYRVRTIERTAQGETTIRVDVFASPDATEPVPDASVSLDLEAQSRVTIGEQTFTLQNRVTWARAGAGQASDVIWDPSNRLGTGFKPETLTYGDHTFAPFIGTVTAASEAWFARSRGTDAEQRAYFDDLFAVPTRTVGNPWRVANPRWDAGDRYEGFSTAANARYWLTETEHYRNRDQAIDGLGRPLDFAPDFDKLKFRLRGEGIPSDSELVAYLSPWINELSITTDKADRFGKHTLFAAGGRPNNIQPLDGPVDRSQYIGYYSNAFPYRSLLHVPDWIDPATLLTTRQVTVKLDSDAVIDADAVTIPSGSRAPLVRRRILLQNGDIAGATDTRDPNNPPVGFVDVLDDDIPPSDYMGGTGAASSVLFSVSDAPADPPGVFESTTAGMIPFEFSQIVDLAPVQDGGANRKLRYATARNFTDRLEFVSRDDWREIWNDLMRAIVDYMNPPSDTGTGMATPRLHALRVRPAGVAAPLPAIPGGLNTSYRLERSAAAVPYAAIVDYPAEYTPFVETERAGFLIVSSLEFEGVATTTLSGEDIRDLGLVINPSTGQYTFPDGEPVSIPDGQIFRTVAPVAPGDTIDVGGEFNFHGDTYPMILAPEDTLSAAPTARTLTVAPAVGEAIASNADVNLVERIVPPADDSRSVWGYLDEFRSRQEVTSGVDDSGSVEQRQIVDRAVFVIRQTDVQPGAYLRDEKGRLWKIVGVADDTRNRRNIVLTCERELARERTATTFPRFAVPLRRV